MRIRLCEPYTDPRLLARAFGGNCFAHGDPKPHLNGISTDSNEVEAGDLFLCLRGKNTSGERYLPDALARGAAGICTGQGCELSIGDFWHIEVEDCEQALLRAAGAWRRLSKAHVIAVTGSAGKTTAKETISAVLGDVPHNRGNFNSTVGMPLSVLEMPPARAWVLELGINHIGEMEKMAGALQPDLGVITNVGTAHIGQFGGYDRLLSEKMKLAEHLGCEGKLLLPISLKKSMFLAPLCHLFSFGEDMEASFSPVNITMEPTGVSCDLRGGDRVITNLRWPIGGQIGLSVLSIAGAVGIIEGCGEHQIRTGIEKVAQNLPRMRTYYAGGRLLVDDSYNASPESVMASLEALRIKAGSRPRVAVLGDILELGEYSEALHAALGISVAAEELSLLFTYGEAAREIAEAAVRAGMPQTAVFSFSEGKGEALAQAICSLSPKDAVVLFKASHKMKLSSVVMLVGGIK